MHYAGVGGFCPSFPYLVLLMVNVFYQFEPNKSTCFFKTENIFLLKEITFFSTDLGLKTIKLSRIYSTVHFLDPILLKYFTGNDNAFLYCYLYLLPMKLSM